MENPVKYASRMYKKCEICNKRRIPQSSIFLARFPLGPARCWMWVKTVGLEDLIYVPIEKLHELKFICGQHFKPEDFNTKGNCLCKSAISTLELRYPPLSDELLVDFPLHMKSLQKENVQTGVLREVANIMDSVKVKQPSKENMETQVTTFTPMPSTSTHGETSQEIFGPLQSPNIKTLVAHASTSMASTSTIPQRRTSNKTFVSGEDNLTNKEKKLLRKLQNAKLTIKKLNKTSLNLDKL